MKGKSDGRIYLDYAATTPVDPRVMKKIEPYFSGMFGNPESLHSFGQEAHKAIDEAREILAKALGCDFREVVFTGSATEANNIFLRGIAKNYLRAMKAKNGEKILPPKIIVSSVEHACVFRTALDLERDGVEAAIVPVDENGVVDIKVLKRELDERTILVSIMYVNNETGTVQPISEISKIIRDFRSSKPQAQSSKSNAYPFFHTDAVQALPFFDCDVDALGVDAMTVSSHKMYGPKGVGALYVREKSVHGGESAKALFSERNQALVDSMSCPMDIFDFGSLAAVITGGGQEFGLRSGTHNVPAIVGFGEAVRIGEEEKKESSKRIEDFRGMLLRGIRTICPDIKVNGEGNSSLGQAPHILNVCLPNHDAQDVLTRLDMEGIAVSAGSACSSRAVKPSRVILSLGYSKERALHSIRFSLGKPTTEEDILGTLDALKRILV